MRLDRRAFLLGAGGAVVAAIVPAVAEPPSYVTLAQARAYAAHGRAVQCIRIWEPIRCRVS